MNLALFDLDNTLLSGDTDVEWLGFLAEQGVVGPADRDKNREMDLRYASGDAEPLEYVRFYLGYYAPHPMERLLAWRDAFIERRIRPRMLPAARRLLERQDGNLVAIITATNRFQDGKIARVDAWLAAQGRAPGDFPQSSFSSDSRNDLPLLERVTHPVAVDADARLSTIARRRGWEMLTLR